MEQQLINAVIQQLGGVLSEGVEGISDTLTDVRRTGADAGFSGFIYYSETSDFFDNNRKVILDYLKQEAEEYGIDAITMVQGFNCVDATADEVGAVIYGVEDDTHLKNALAWYALESVAHRLGQ